MSHTMTTTTFQLSLTIDWGVPSRLGWLTTAAMAAAGVGSRGADMEPRGGMLGRREFPATATAGAARDMATASSGIASAEGNTHTNLHYKPI